MSLTQINKAGLDEIALDHVFTIGASGSSAYTFQGEGLNGTVNNPTLYLTRGKTYRFENGSGGHPIRIQSTSGASGTAYNTGVTNNAGSGTVIVEVQHDAPDVLYYQCTSHAAMNGILYITGALADGGVTTAKIADDAVTAAKIASGAVNTSELADGGITSAKLSNNSVNADKIAANSVNTSELVDGGITTAKIANSQITTAKLDNNAVTTTKIADDQITTAKINDDAVTNAKIAAGAVGGTQLGSNAVTAAKIGANEVTSTAIAAGAVGSAKIADQAVTLDKLPHGTGSTDGKFLRANNGADPSFESIPAGITINNQADNRVITATGTTDTLNGESELTYNGSFLKINPSSNDNPLQVDTGSGNGAHMRFLQNGSTKLYLGCGGGISLGDANDLTMRATDDILFATGNTSTLKMQIDQDGAVTIPSQPSFSAKNSTNADFTWTNMTRFPFNTELFDRGYDYDNSNYIFTAPVDGIYQINFFTITRNNTSNFQPGIRKNGSTIYRSLSSFSHQTGTSLYHNISFSVLFPLSANDYIDVMNVSGFNMTVHGAEYSGFSAYLVA